MIQVIRVKKAVPSATDGMNIWRAESVYQDFWYYGFMKGTYHVYAVDELGAYMAMWIKADRWYNGITVRRQAINRATNKPNLT